MDTNIASVIKFADLCKAFQTTCETKKQDKGIAFSSFIKQCKEQALKLKAEHPNAKTSFYPVLRLMLPQLERERAAYGLKEHTLGKRLIKILCLPLQGSDAMRLANFKTSSVNSNVRDFADAAYWVLRKHFLDGANISIAKVNEYLDALAEKHAENDPRGVDEQLHNLLKETTPEEQKWLIRIILKDLRIGMGHDRILKLYHPDAADLFSASNSLTKVCDMLFDSSVRLHEIAVSLFEPFRPMLSQKCDAVQFKKLFDNNSKLYIETKFDGERFQLHMENGNFKYFSRNGFEYTGTYGANYSSGVYTPRLKDAFKSHVKRVILDGEMMGWNTRSKKFGSKGMEFDVKHLKADNIFQPCFCVFDVVLLNDQILSNKPLQERLLILNTLFTPVLGVIIASRRAEATSRQHILDALNNSMDREEEGIVFKDVKSVYKSNDRNAGWWKMKLEYFENVMSDLDVIVMGGYYGEGRNRHRITGFLVAVAIPPTDDDKTYTPSGYLSFAKVSSGLSDNELTVIDQNLGPHWKKLNEGNPEEYGLQWSKDKPDVWIPPNKSCILLVRASEIIRTHSNDFKTDYTLRFPRIQKIRLDKPYYDCLTIEELLAMTGKKLVQKLNKRHLELEDLEVAEKERKIRRRYLNVEMQPVEQTSEVLNGYQFCVLTGTADWKKDDIETVIRENGGAIVKNEGPETLCILVGNDHPRVKSCKQYDAPYDLVKLQWLSSILNSHVFKMYTPLDMLHISKKTKEKFLAEYDKYGDSYLEDATSESLENIMENIQKSNDYVHLTPYEVDNLTQELNCANPINTFEKHVAYFDSPEKDFKIASNRIHSATVEEITFKFLGGTIRNILNENVSLVVMDESDTSRRKQITKYLSQINNTKAEIVNRDFINEKLNQIEAML